MVQLKSGFVSNFITDLKQNQVACKERHYEEGADEEEDWIFFKDFYLETFIACSLVVPISDFN